VDDPRGLGGRRGKAAQGDTAAWGGANA